MSFDFKLSVDVQLSPQEYEVIREKGTERAGSGEYDKMYPKQGYFACRACSTPLYSAAAKFSSGCGWPAFDKCVKGKHWKSVEIFVFLSLQPSNIYSSR